MFLLLYFGKNFGVSGNLRTICAAGGAGSHVEFFKFDWKKQIWNLMFALGTVGGGFVAYQWAVIAGLLWFAALGVYGQGAALMGDLGPVIGWPMLLGLALVISSALGVFTGEWKGAPGPLKTMLGGIAVVIVAICVLGYSNSL